MEEYIKYYELVRVRRQTNPRNKKLHVTYWKKKKSEVPSCCIKEINYIQVRIQAYIKSTK